MTRVQGVPAEITEETAAHWAAGAAGELTVEKCTACGLHVFPPRGVCSRCRGRDMAVCRVDPPGVVYSSTVNHKAWSPDADPVYTIGLIEFPDYSGIRFVGMFEDFDTDPEIGDQVDFHLVTAFDNRYQLRFTPWEAT